MATISQIDLFSAIVKHLDKKERIKTMVPRQYNAVIAGCNLIVDAMAVDEIRAKPGMSIDEWLKTDDVGASSMYVAHVITGAGDREYAYPLDCDDFSRCYKLLTCVASTSDQIGLMGGTGPEWEALLKVWDELWKLYEAGDFKKVSVVMREALKAVGSQ